MEAQELLEYLKDIDDFSVSPWIAVTERAEAIGDPATPSREHTAVLRWLGKALEIWEKEFPLESRLANQVRRLKPLAAALAITDVNFMKPGAHPLHQLLDTIQTRAIGWQSRLDRVGTALEAQISQAVDSARVWFQVRDTNLQQICAEFTTAAERDQARAQRMVQRVVDTEAGKVRTAAAKQEAARMINASLEKYQAPAEIGEFIKGHWYTSAQLLLLKFGADSDEWKQMSATTETFMDSLQSLTEADDVRRQRIFEVVTRIPKEMRRWLLSLHHDTEAVNEAMGMVEFVHLRILRQQPVEMQSIAAIVVDDNHALTGEQRHAHALRKWSEGQWFLVRSEGSVLRAQLVLKIDQSQQLLFTNMAGLKVLQLSYEEFNQLLLDKQAAPLASGAGFSLCLARAAGVTSVEILEALASAMADSDQETGTAPGAAADAPAAPEPSLDFLPAEEEGDSLFAENEGEDGADLPYVEFDDAEEPGPAETQPVETPGDEPDLQGEEPADGEDYVPDLPAVEPALHEAEAPPAETPEVSSGFLADQAKEISARRGVPGDEPTGAGAGDGVGKKSFEDESRRFLSDARTGDTGTDDAARDTPDETLSGNPEAARGDQPQDNLDSGGETAERRITLPAGVWIGFHDGQTPVMARLAVHDPQEDHFIFVNRKGVKIRQVSGTEFLALIDEGMVEILEASTNFRDAVTEVRKKRDQ